MSYDTYMVSKNYENSLTKNVGLMNEQLGKGNISEAELKTLLGVVLKVEMNKFLQFNIKRFAPEQEAQATFVNYAHTRKINHAS